MRECFVRVALTSTPVSTCQNLRTVVRKVEADGGNGRVKRGVGVQNGCATAAADINARLAKKGNVLQKGGVKNAFQNAVPQGTCPPAESQNTYKISAPRAPNVSVVMNQSPY